MPRRDAGRSVEQELVAKPALKTGDPAAERPEGKSNFASVIPGFYDLKVAAWSAVSNPLPSPNTGRMPVVEAPPPTLLPELAGGSI